MWHSINRHYISSIIPMYCSSTTSTNLVPWPVSQDSPYVPVRESSDLPPPFAVMPLLTAAADSLPTSPLLFSPVPGSMFFAFLCTSLQQLCMNFNIHNIQYLHLAGFLHPSCKRKWDGHVHWFNSMSYLTKHRILIRTGIKSCIYSISVDIYIQISLSQIFE